MPVLVSRLSGSVKSVVHPRDHYPPDSSCPGLSRASTFSTDAKEHVDGRDKHGHDDKRGERAVTRRRCAKAGTRQPCDKHGHDDNRGVRASGGSPVLWQSRNRTALEQVRPWRPWGDTLVASAS